MATLPKNYRPLSGSERKPGPRARHIGPAADNDPVKVTVILRRRPDGPPVPDHAFYRATPPARRPRLSAADFAATYGAHPDDIAKVLDFAKGHGLTVG